MKELSTIVEKYNKLRKTSAKLALATVIDVEGSSYRRTGARMLIQDNGIWTGGISGGCIEGDALKKASLAIAGKKTIQITYDTSKENEEQIGVSLGCNGLIRVLITPIDYNDENNPLEQLNKCVDTRGANILITVIEAENHLPIRAGQVIKYTTGQALEISLKAAYQQSIYDDIQLVLQQRKSKIITYPGCKLFIEFIPPPIHIIIMGGNYDVYPLLKITATMGWRKTIVANPRRLANNIHQLANDVVSDLAEVDIDKYTIAIIMSHDYQADLNNLAKALQTELAYIGLLGPASRKIEMLAELPFKIDKDIECRIFGPVGLDIGASQPEEIAISIVSEILAVLRNRPGSLLKNRQETIYDR